MIKTLSGFIVITLLFALIGCTKENDNSSSKKLLISKMRVVYTAGSDVYSYKYDDQVRIVSAVEVRQANINLEREYTYNDNGLAEMNEIIDNVSSLRLNNSYYSANGDTVILQRLLESHIAGLMDTVRYTYIFKNEQLIEEWMYDHMQNRTPAIMWFEKIYYSYNEDGNITKIESEGLNRPRETKWEFFAWDDKVNPFYKQALENWYEYRGPFGLRSSSVNNPTLFKYLNSSVQEEMNMTYNEHDYPISFSSAAFPKVTYQYEYE